VNETNGLSAGFSFGLSAGLSAGFSFGVSAGIVTEIIRFLFYWPLLAETGHKSRAKLNFDGSENQPKRRVCR
jgi:hypothetical protein